MHQFQLPQRHVALFSKVESGAQLNRLNEFGGIPVELAVLAGRPVHIEFQGTQGNSLSVWKTTSKSGFRSVRKMDSNLNTIRFVDQGAMLRSDRGGAITLVERQEVIFTSFDEMYHEEAGPGFSSINATVSREEFAKSLLELEVNQDCTWEDGIIRPSEIHALKSLRQSLLYLSINHPSTMSQSDLTTPLIQNLLIYQIISAYYTTSYADVDRRIEYNDKAVKRAIDYIETNIAKNISVVDIAAAAGIGARRLQIVFKKLFGYGPVQYVISRRLDLVYSSLLNREGERVGDIAMRWGFVHMSDFSQRFKERFGVTPKIVLTSR